MKLTRDEAFKLTKTLNELDVKKYSKYFLLAISNAKKTLKAISDGIDEKVKSLSFPEQSILMNKRLEIIKKYAVKDDNGVVKIVDEKVEFINDDEKLCQAEIEQLFRDNVDVLQKADELNKQFEEYILESIEVDFLKVKFEYFPDELDEKLYEILDIFRKESAEEVLG